MRKIFFLLYSCCWIQVNSLAQSNGTSIRPGKIWLDSTKQPINAHGGGILYNQGKYYWFGEVKKGKTWRVPGVSSWEDYRVNAGGVACYASTDLVNWKYLSLALSPEQQDSSSEIHISRVIERPKVIFNSKTGKFVMWMHIDKEDYSYAHAGVAVSDKAEGPYKYLGSFQPNSQESRDMTIFQDEDQKAYLVYASENNMTMQVCLLSDDYLKPTTNYKRILINAHREAPALFKFKQQYYLITSLCTGWDPNKALFAVADHLLGNWKMWDNPCYGQDADSTYHAQSTFVFPIAGKLGEFVFMADRWNKTDLENSSYIWLPLYMDNHKPYINWRDQWTPNLK